MEPTTAALLASAAAQLGGSIWGASSAASSQNATNRANAAIAARQSQDALNSWLVSRGINPGISALPSTSTIVAAHPELQTEWQRVYALGDKRPFEEWLQGYLRENPNSSIAQEFTSGAVNTTLPLWSTVNGQPTEQFLLNRILQTSGMIDPATAAETEFARVNPSGYEWWNSYRKETGSNASLPELMRDYYSKNPGDPPGEAELAVMNPKAAQSGAVPAAYQGLQDAAVASAGRIFDGGYLSDELNALAPALAARRKAADLGFDRNSEMRSRVGDIYSAELLAADTYGNSAMDAVSRVLAENKAKRALQGYSGGSSFDDLTRARTLAPALNAGALARATAGVNKAKSLSGILDTDVQIGQQNADLQNAIDRLQLISGDINRKIGASNLPVQLYSNKVQMDNLASDARFTDLDATLKRLGMFTSNNSTPPTPTYAQAQPSITGGQIAGQALSTLGQMGMNYWSTQSLLNGLKNTGGSTYKGIPVANTPDTASTGKWW